MDNEDSFDDGSLVGLEWEEEEEPSDTLEDNYYGEDDEGYWLSEDHLAELKELNATDKIPPPLKDWNEVEPTVRIQITVAKARRLLWQQAQEEIKMHRLNVANISKTATNYSGQKRVYELLFGCGSRLFQLFKEELGLTTETYLLFLLTYFKSSCYRMSVAGLQKLCYKFFLMDTVIYNQIWSKISKLPRKATGESIWQQTETVLNTAFVRGASTEPPQF